MTNVKVTLKGKNGKEFEALVPIKTACKVLCYGEDVGNICKVSYSVVRKCRDFLRTHGASEDVKVRAFFALMEHSNTVELLNGVLLYRD